MCDTLSQERIQGGERPSLNLYKSNFIHHDFLQFGKQCSRYKAILSSIILSQQCCEAYFIPLAVAKPLRTDYQGRH